MYSCVCLLFATEVLDDPALRFNLIHPTEERLGEYFIKKIPLANPKLNPSSFHFQVYCHYYNDLNKDDFPFNEDYLGERVKRGMEVENTFKQCYRRWLKDFKIALYISDSEVLE